MTIPHDIERCAGNGDPQCTDCQRREPGSPYSSNGLPVPSGTECDKRIVTLDVAILEIQGRGD